MSTQKMATDLQELHRELGTTEDQVRSVIESFIELGVSVYDFPGTPEATQGMVTNLKRNVDRIFKLNQRSNDPQSLLKDVKVPLEVVQYIEDGRNPDIYTREFVEAIRRSNQYQRAKMHGMKMLRDSLADKIAEQFPELKSEVDGIIKRTDGIQVNGKSGTVVDNSAATDNNTASTEQNTGSETVPNGDQAHSTEN